MTAKTSAPPDRKTLREAAEPWLFIAPSLILLLGIGLYPMVYTLFISFHQFVMGMGAPTFNSGVNYITAIESGGFLHAILRTLALLAITLPVELALGLLIAIALDSEFNPLLRKLLQICLVIPIAITPAVVGLLTQLMFNDQLGIINHLLHAVGIDPIDWLGGLRSAFATVVFVHIWEWTPFVALVLSASLSTVPKDIEEAAMLETEHWWPRFKGVQLPYMWPGITAALVFQTAFTMKEFDMIYAIEKGGPGAATQMAILHIERLAFRGFDIGVAAAESILMLVLSIVLARIYIRLFYSEVE